MQAITFVAHPNAGNGEHPHAGKCEDIGAGADDFSPKGDVLQTSALDEGRYNDESDNAA